MKMSETGQVSGWRGPLHFFLTYKLKEDIIYSQMVTSFFGGGGRQYKVFIIRLH